METKIKKKCEKCKYDIEENFFRKNENICYLCSENNNKCEVCGVIGKWNYKANFLGGIRCKKHKENNMINVTNKMGKERFAWIVEEKWKGKIIEEYGGSGTKVKCICREKHPCSPRPNDIQQGKNICSICTGNNKEVAGINFIEKIKQMGGTVEETYQGKDTPVKCICKYGHNCSPTPSSIRQGRGMCLTCSGQNKEIAEKKFIEKIEQMGGTVVEIYQGNKIPVKCICKYGHNYFPRPNNIQQGVNMCPYCNNKTEGKFSDYLKQAFPNLHFIHQYKLQDCINPKTKKPLPFDFCFPNLKIIVEIDGPQHFKQISNWQSPEETQERDNFKAKIALEKGFTIFRLLQEDIYYDKTNWRKALSEQLYLRDEPEQLFFGLEYLDFIS